MIKAIKLNDMDISFNSTLEELKYGLVQFLKLPFNTFNSTLEELKFGTREEKYARTDIF